jgi:hypothetical protein
MNLVLDMDGTLICGCDIFGTLQARPHLETFLEECFSLFNKVSIWTAANKNWFSVVNETIFIPILDKINKKNNTKHKFDFVFTRERCKDIYSSFGYGIVRTEKRLRKLHKSKKLYKDYTIDNTIIIDDTADTFSSNYSNAILVNTYFSPSINENDVILLKLLTYFKSILIPYYHKHSTIRTLEKRYWKIDVLKMI